MLIRVGLFQWWVTLLYLLPVPILLTLRLAGFLQHWSGLLAGVVDDCALPIVFHEPLPARLTPMLFILLAPHRWICVIQWFGGRIR